MNDHKRVFGKTFAELWPTCTHAAPRLTAWRKERKPHDRRR